MDQITMTFSYEDLERLAGLIHEWQCEHDESHEDWEKNRQILIAIERKLQAA